MTALYNVHRILGEMILPLLTVLAAIWYAVVYKNPVQFKRAAVALPILVTLQWILGLAYLLSQVVAGNGARYASGLFILHPIVGLLAIIFATRARKPRGFALRFGRWAPLAMLGCLLLALIVGTGLASAIR